LKNDPELQHINCPPFVPVRSAEVMGELCHLELHQVRLNEDASFSTEKKQKTPLLEVICCLVERETE
jgi:hypothetical protein